MKTDNNKLLYVANLPSGGVEKKIQGFCDSAINSGYCVEHAFEKVDGLKGIQRQIHSMLSSDAKYIVMRNPTRDCIYYLFCFIWLRIQGKVLIIDQPSPAATYIKEIDSQNRPFVSRFIKKLLTYIGCPFTFLLANRIIQYGDESPFFRFFSGSRILLTGNGIDTKRIPLRQQCYPDGKNRLSIIGVAANVSGWHGFDRIVKAIGKWKMSNSLPTISFDIVGNIHTPHGQCIQNMVKQYGIEDCVHFLGFKSSDELNDLYSKASLGVASLGLFRNGLSIASVLKAREYCLSGMPFISSGIDPDFPDSVPFRFVVSDDDGIDDIIQLFNNFVELRKTFTDSSIREYAIEHLSYDVKFQEIMKGL